MDTLSINQATIWLTLGFLLLAIEAIAFGFTSGLLLFGSLGALLTGGLLWLSVVPNSFVAAIACFAVATSVITLVLWRPLKRLQSGAELGHDRSSDLIGLSFVLSSDVSDSAPGVHKYSGIHWRVEPAEQVPDRLISAGTRVKVSAVSVGVFYVEPFTEPTGNP
ncbi:NfeD family protein [Granulosicoccus sp. 3-233]|uniref:NfeD family protein n=1 Tax=Granulosicoccus sp. 3-233 TaxID=3417969 RepID=UPI003D358124